MQDISVDEDQNTVTIQPGVTAGELLAELIPRNVYTSVPNLDVVGVWVCAPSQGRGAKGVATWLGAY